MTVHLTVHAIILSKSEKRYCHFIMGKHILPLSEVHVKNAKRKEKDYKLFDGDGLYLIVWNSPGRKSNRG